MQIKSLRIKSYKSWAINDTARADAVARMKMLKLYRKLKAEGCSRTTLPKALPSKSLKPPARSPAPPSCASTVAPAAAMPGVSLTI